MARFICIAFSLFLLSSCSTNLSPKDRQRIQSVRISPVTEGPKAYWKPSLTSPEQNLAIVMTGGAGAVAVAAYEAASTSLSDKKSQARDTRDAIKSLIPNLPDILGREFEKSLTKTTYFGPRLKGAAGSTFQVKTVIFQYTLYRRKGGAYSPGIGAEAWIIDPSGKKLAHRSYLVLPLPSNNLPSAPLADYVKKPGLLKAHFEEVTRLLADNLAQSLEAAATE